MEEHFCKHPPISINAAIATIESLTGIRRSPTQVRLFLKSLGMKRLKASCGRKRYNVLAAVTAITYGVMTVTNDSYINALKIR